MGGVSKTMLGVLPSFYICQKSASVRFFLRNEKVFIFENTSHFYGIIVSELVERNCSFINLKPFTVNTKANSLYYEVREKHVPG